MSFLSVDNVKAFENCKPITLLPPKLVKPGQYSLPCVTTEDGSPYLFESPDGNLVLRKPGTDEWDFHFESTTFDHWLSKLTNSACSILYNRRDQWFRSNQLSEADFYSKFDTDVTKKMQIALTVDKNALVVDKYVKMHVNTTSIRVSDRSEWKNATVVIEIAELQVVNAKFKWNFVGKLVNIVSEITCKIELIDHQHPIATPSVDMVVLNADSLKADGIEEVEIELDKLVEDETKVVPRNEVYYAQYKEGMQRANQAKELAINMYLEARRIKDTYLMDCVTDTEDEWDEEDVDGDD